MAIKPSYLVTCTNYNQIVFEWDTLKRTYAKMNLAHIFVSSLSKKKKKVIKMTRSETNSVDEQLEQRTIHMKLTGDFTETLK